MGNLIFGFWLLAPTFELQVLGRNCQGISGALVEVWYAGGEPGLENAFHQMLASFEACEEMQAKFQDLSELQKNLESQNERPFAEGCKSMSSLSHVQGNVGYTFSEEDPVLWYRGRVNADSQGRYFKATLAVVVGQQK